MEARQRPGEKGCRRAIRMFSEGCAAGNTIVEVWCFLKQRQFNANQAMSLGFGVGAVAAWERVEARWAALGRLPATRFCECSCTQTQELGLGVVMDDFKFSASTRDADANPLASKLMNWMRGRYIVFPDHAEQHTDTFASRHLTIEQVKGQHDEGQ